MRKASESGLATSALLIVFMVLALIGALAFSFWAYSQRQDYKNNTDKKIAVVVEAAKKDQAVELQKEFEQESKNPNKTFQSGVSSGSITFNYPKTWSAYVDEGLANQLINGYFHPNIVPGLGSNSAYALRVEMLSDDYSQVVDSLNRNNKLGNLTASAYIPPKMEGVANVQPGTRFDGAIAKDKNGAVVVIKVRDKTLKVYTESADFLNDFND